VILQTKIINTRYGANQLSFGHKFLCKYLQSGMMDCHTFIITAYLRLAHLITVVFRSNNIECTEPDYNWNGGSSYRFSLHSHETITAVVTYITLFSNLSLAAALEIMYVNQTK
jgi:hypothetical protein